MSGTVTGGRTCFLSGAQAAAARRLPARIRLDGDPKTFATIAALTGQPDPTFPIVTP